MALAKLSILHAANARTDAASTSFVTPPRRGREAPKLRPEAINLDGFFLSTMDTKQGRMHWFVALNIAKKLQDKASIPLWTAKGETTTRPLYTPATADLQTLRLEGIRRPSGEKLANGKEKKILAPIASVIEQAYAHISNYQVLILSEYTGGSQSLPYPTPMTLARAYNVSLSQYEDGCILNTDLIRPEDFAEFNLLAPADRVRLAFPNDRQVISGYDEWHPLFTHLRRQFGDKTVIDDSIQGTKIREKKRELLRSYIPTLRPVLRLEGNCFYTPNGNVEIPFPGIGHPSRAAVVAPRAVLSESVSAAFETFSGVTRMEERVYEYKEAVGTTPPMWLLNANFEFGVATFLPDAAQPSAMQQVKKVKLYAKTLASLGVYVPTWIPRLLALHPVPFEAVTTIELIETLTEPNNPPLTTDNEPYPSGYMHGEAVAGSFEMLRYLRDVGGIPVSREVVTQRHGTTGMTSTKFTTSAKKQQDIVGDPDNKDFKAVAAIFDKVRAYTDAKALGTYQELLALHGFYCLDAAMSRPIPPVDAPVDYFALNLFEAVDPERLLKSDRPDTTSGLPVAMQPKVTHMSLAQGDALVLEPIKNPWDWVVGSPPVPRYLFFVVAKRDVQAEEAAILKARASFVDTMALPVAVSQQQQAEHAHLPATVRELRQHLIKLQVASAEGHALPVPSVTPPETLKRDFDEMHSTDVDKETEEPPQKAPRGEDSDSNDM